MGEDRDLDKGANGAWIESFTLFERMMDESAHGGRLFGDLSAVTQRPMPMYHSWGSQNAWLRQIHGRNHLYINRQTAKGLDLADDDGAVATELVTVTIPEKDYSAYWLGAGIIGGAYVALGRALHTNQFPPRTYRYAE